MPSLRDLLLQGLTGSTQEELQDRAYMGEGPISVGPGGAEAASVGASVGLGGAGGAAFSGVRSSLGVISG